MNHEIDNTTQPNTNLAETALTLLGTVVPPALYNIVAGFTDNAHTMDVPSTLFFGTITGFCAFLAGHIACTQSASMATTANNLGEKAIVSGTAITGAIAVPYLCDNVAQFVDNAAPLGLAAKSFLGLVGGSLGAMISYIKYKS